jgi:hypothetical protein
VLERVQRAGPGARRPTCRLQATGIAELVAENQRNRVWKRFGGIEATLLIKIGQRDIVDNAQQPIDRL